MKYHRRIYVLKARGIGITEFLLRLFVWWAVYDNSHQYQIIPIIVGPNIQLATDAIDRVKMIFRPKLGWEFKELETRIRINDMKIMAFPSHNPSSFRGRKDVPAVLIDEADHMTIRNQDDALDAAQGYIGKTDPYIFIVSTPDAPSKLMERMMKDKESKYKKFLYDYTIGLEGNPNSRGRIFTIEEIQEAMQYPSFEREYNLKFLGKIDNVFHQGDIEYAQIIGRDYDPTDESIWNTLTTSKVLGIDTGSSSSATGFVIIQYRHPFVEVLHADDMENPLYEDITEEAYRLMYKYQVDKTYIDGSNVFFVKTFKNKIGDNARGWDWTTNPPKLVVLNSVEEAMTNFEFSKAKVVAVNYKTMTEPMLAHTIKIMEKRLVRINPRFDKLITSLKTAQAEELES